MASAAAAVKSGKQSHRHRGTVRAFVLVGVFVFTDKYGDPK